MNKYNAIFRNNRTRTSRYRHRGNDNRRSKTARLPVIGKPRATIIINKSFNAVSVINLCDILGWGIDAATGAITKPEFKFYQIDFQPKEGTPAGKK